MYHTERRSSALKHAETFEQDFNLTQTGKVELFPWSHLQSGLNTSSAAIFGDRSFGRFGYSVQTTDVDADGSNELLVSAAHRSGSYTSLRQFALKIFP